MISIREKIRICLTMADKPLTVDEIKKQVKVDYKTDLTQRQISNAASQSPQIRGKLNNGRYRYFTIPLTLEEEIIKVIHKSDVHLSIPEICLKVRKVKPKVTVPNVRDEILRSDRIEKAPREVGKTTHLYQVVKVIRKSKKKQQEESDANANADVESDVLKQILEPLAGLEADRQKAINVLKEMEQIIRKSLKEMNHE